MNINEIKTVIESSKAIIPILQAAAGACCGVSALTKTVKDVQVACDSKNSSKKELIKEMACISGKNIAKYGAAFSIIFFAPCLFDGLYKLIITNKGITLAAISKVKIIKELPFIIK